MKKLPYRTYGTVVSVQQFGALVELAQTHEIAILHISKISERFISDVQKFLTPGEIIHVDVVRKTENRIELSIMNIPHYRNKGDENEADFSILATHLPQWMSQKRKEKRRTTQYDTKNK